MSSGCLAVSEADLLLGTCSTVAKADHNDSVDEFSLREELLQPASPKQVEGEAPQNGLLDQQSEVVKDGGEVKEPLFPADKLDGSCPPGESVSFPVLPPLDKSKASAPTELTEKGIGGPFKSISTIQSDGQRSQAPETSAMLGPEEPALHHIDPPAKVTIEKGKYQPGEFNLKYMVSILAHLTQLPIASSSRGSYTKRTFDHPI